MAERVGSRPAAAGAPLTRRALVIGGLGLVAAAVAELLGRPRPALAAEATTAPPADGIRPGVENMTAATTSIRREGAGPAVVVRASPSSSAVVGMAGTGIGLFGIAEDGLGVVGDSTTGNGVTARSRHGVALHVPQGRIRAEGISGRARIARGDRAAIVRPVPLIPADAVVLVTPAGPLDGRELWAVAVEGSDVLEIHLSEPAARDTLVSWLVLG